MRQRIDAFESGAPAAEALNSGLRFAGLSDQLYPNSPSQTELRKTLRDRKAWLDRKTAVLRAFAAEAA